MMRKIRGNTKMATGSFMRGGKFHPLRFPGPQSTAPYKYDSHQIRVPLLIPLIPPAKGQYVSSTTLPQTT